MSIGLVGRKCGMTRVFTDAGETVPVTVIEALPNRVTQVKTVDKDGYRAVQVTFGKRSVPSDEGRRGPLREGECRAGSQTLVEFRLAEGEGADSPPAAKSKPTFSSAGQIVDVTGTTMGKGFAGTMKRHNFAGQHAIARQLGVAPRAGLHRPAPDAGPRVPGQAHVGHMGVVASPSRI